jgi:hypothetical protein
MPSEPLDAPDDLPKEGPGQVTLGKLEHEVPRMPDQAPADLEEPLLEARQGPSLDGDGQNQPTQLIVEVVGDHPEEQPDLVGSEAVAREARPMGGFLACSIHERVFRVQCAPSPRPSPRERVGVRGRMSSRIIRARAR